MPREKLPMNSASLPTLIELTTPRLLLRQWRPEDREPFAAIGADPEVMAFFPALMARAESDACADVFQGQIASNGWGFWAAECRDDGAFAGFVGLKPVPQDLAFAGEVEVGWRLARRYWGRGLATEAASAVLRVGFGQLGLEAIVAFTSEANTAAL